MVRQVAYAIAGALAPVAALLDQYITLDVVTPIHWAKLAVAGLMGAAVAVIAKRDNKDRPVPQK